MLLKRTVAFLLIAITIVQLGSMAFLSFYNHPSTDDFFLAYHIKIKGLVGYNEFIYNNWGGRYFTNFIASFFAKEGWFLNHYYFHSLLLVAITLAAHFLLLFYINRQLQNIAPKVYIIGASFCLSVMQISCLAEASTAFYWFSSGVTYQLSYALIICCQIAFYEIFIQQKKTISPLLICGILIICINGSNEIAATINGLLCFAQLMLIHTKRKEKKGLVILLISLYLLSLIISLSAPGNFVRASALNNLNLVSIIANSFINTGYIFYNIFASTYFIVVFGLTFFVGCIYNQLYFLHTPKKYSLQKLALIFVAILLNTIIAHFLLLFLSNGSIPERATNLFIEIIVLLLVAWSFIAGKTFALEKIINVNASGVVFTIALVVLLMGSCFNTFTGNLIKNILSAPLHSGIIQQQRNLVEQQKKITYIPSYTKAKQILYDSTYNPKPKKVFEKLIQQQPNFISTFQDLEKLENREWIQKYYGVDSIVIAP